MVRISSSGEILGDDQPHPDHGPTRRHQDMGRVQHDDDPGGRQQGSGFDAINQRLVGYGFPRFNIGSHTIEPIVTVAFILAGLFLGLPGLVLAALLFFVVKASSAHGGLQSFMGGGGAQPGAGGSGQGSGQRLGNS